MRFVRRASLVFSVVLIAAIVVGFVARSADLSGDRDAELGAAVELAAERVDGLVQAATLVAFAGGSPGESTEALVDAVPGAGVCVLDAGTETCAGDPGLVYDVERWPAEQDPGRTVDVSASGGNLVVVATLGDRAVRLVAPLGAIAGGDGPRVSVVDAGAAVAATGSDQQVALATPAVGAVQVVATGSSVGSLPTDEFRFYLIVFALAVALLVLAGITLVVEQRSLEERASYDALTRLPNRGEFELRASEAIGTAQRAGTSVAIALLDLDGFKTINDRWGHLVGDEMLKMVSARLRRAAGERGLVGRWGGDEFVVLMSGVADHADATRRARSYVERVAANTRVDGVAESLHVSASAGVALWPGDGATLEELIASADRAMYADKHHDARGGSDDRRLTLTV